MALRIEDYGIIGDCETAALVGLDGSIDWLCWPRFDSGACFAALLGSDKHGRWRIAPLSDKATATRAYRKDTLILETRFETETGVATLIDFMPLRGDRSHLVRLVRGDSGRVTFCTELVIRFGYGEIVPWVTKAEDRTLRAIAGPDKLVMRTPVELRGENMRTVGQFEVAEGETTPFVLTYGPSHLPDPPVADPLQLLRSTEQFWDRWTATCNIEGPYAQATRRSLITLKALTYAPTGGLVAAATTSLPEQLGGQRNWDYRYCWLRDATLTLLAFMNTGYYDEARAWREWLLRAVAGSPGQTQIMYGLAGERRLIELELPWLPGYEDSAPVRIGNDAHRQLQLDVYGELFDTLYQARKGGLEPDTSGGALQMAIVMLEHLGRRWNEPDHGIWEVRSDPLHFTYSKVMTWVAFDRAIKAVEDFGLNGPVDRWRDLRDSIHEHICRNGFDRDLNSFVRSYGEKDVDASLLLLPTVGFLPPEDPRIRGTVDRIERTLIRDGLVLRYDSQQSEDGLWDPLESTCRHASLSIL